MVKLDAAIKYREEDLRNARILVEQFDADDPDTEVNMACLDFKVLLSLNRRKKTIICSILRKENMRRR